MTLKNVKLVSYVLLVASALLPVASTSNAASDMPASAEEEPMALPSPGDSHVFWTQMIHLMLTDRDGAMVDPSETQSRAMTELGRMIVIAAHPEMYATIGEGAREVLSMIAQWALDHDVMTYHPWDDWPEERVKQRIRIAKCIADVKGGDINDLMACADATRQ